jgi:tetratricopeptide (TPR) repeat protein
MKKLLAIILAAAALAVSTAAFAAPSARDVDNAISQGNWQQAHTDLAQVLQAHPNSAHAHYLYGQVLAREGRPAEALAELEKARSLDPQLRFASSPAQFSAIEARIQQQANRAASRGVPSPSAQFSGGTVSQNNGAALAPLATAAAHDHGPSAGMWIVFALVLALVVLVVRWTLRRARSNDDGRAQEQRRAQLKRATDLLNAVRSLKLDVRLSTAPGHEALLGEVEAAETQLRELTDKLSNNGSPVPDYTLENLERRVESLKARTEGRPDPNAAAAPGADAAAGGNPSVYAQEAERFGQTQGGVPPPAPQQPQTVVVQQPGGVGGGMGGLLTGVLLGQMLGGSRERVVERDVIVDDERRHGDAGADPGIDVGRGNDNWDDGGGGGGIDVGSSDDDSNWS